MDHSPAQAWIVDETGRLLYANPALLRLFGRPAEEVLGLRAEELLPPEWHAQYLEHNRQVLECDHCLEFFETYPRQDGTVGVGLVKKFPLRDRAGRRLVGGVAFDMTEQRQADAALRQADQHLRDLIHSLDGIVWEADAQTFEMLFVSNQAERILGYPVARWTEEPGFWASHVHPDDRLWALDFCKRAVAEGRHHEFDYRMIAADGRTVWLHDVVSVVVENGRPARLRGVMVDISERKQAELALREAEEKYRSLFENAVEGIYQSTPDGRFLTVNPALVRMAGFESADEMIRTWTDIEHQVYVDPQRRRDFLREIVQRGEVRDFEGEVFVKDGSTRWISQCARAVRDAQGRVDHIEGRVLDVTEKKRLEQQFLQAQKMEAIGRLAGGVAHDFNNLLMIINGYCEILLDGVGPDDPAREPLDEIRQAGQRAATLIHQLLAFGRRQIFAPQVIDLNAVVQDVERMLRRVIGEDIDLVLELTATGLVKADPAQLQQVLMNLVVNSRDAMPTGGRLVIRTELVHLHESRCADRPEVRSGYYVLLAVSDTGCGMDEDTKARVFEPFFTTKGQGKGTGLGLATVYGIIQQSEGHIEVESAAGRGTRFRIYLPCVSPEPQEPDSSADSQAPLRGRENVLLVEDEPGVRGIVARTLRSLGYQVLEAPQGDVALTRSDEFQGTIHLLVTDVVLPGMGGREIADALTARRPGIKVLYLSGYTGDAVLRRGVQEHEVAFLQKPFSTAMLARKVRAVLDAPAGTTPTA
jgi:PAS domain S-box-containing protein